MDRRLVRWGCADGDRALHLCPRAAHHTRGGRPPHRADGVPQGDPVPLDGLSPRVAGMVTHGLVFTAKDDGSQHLLKRVRFDGTVETLAPLGLPPRDTDSLALIASPTGDAVLVGALRGEQRSLQRIDCLPPPD